LAESNKSWQIVLIGKVGEGSPNDKIDSLDNIENIHFMGPRSYGSLACYLKAFDVAILPTLKNEYTKSMFPMKFFEYLMAGKNVVSTRLDSLTDYEEFYFPADTPEEFCASIKAVLQDDSKINNPAILEVLYKNTYEYRNKKMLEIICSE
ncbi:glycosyltransferase, partial [Marinomonas spartinae]|uniref:glycosyltransferase n=1 Tax=Marinomonas spartinae TaxID=1792290 RepID=UPI0018F22C1E